MRRQDNETGPGLSAGTNEIRGDATAGKGESEAGGSVAGESVVVPSVGAESGSVPPDTAESAAAESGSVPPDTAESAAAESGSVPPDTVESVAADSGSVPPDTVESAAAESGTAVLDTAESVAVDPEVEEHGAVESEAAESGAADPGAADPGAADPEAAESGAANPGVDDSGMASSEAPDSGVISSEAPDSGDAAVGAMEPGADEPDLAELRAKLGRLPDRPGVYIFKNAAGEPIYVGKAVSLRNRVRSYFTSLHGQGPKVRVMSAQIADFDFIVTDSEVEALILEANLIKQKKPRYNVRLRDDKAYPYLKVTWNEPYPRVVLARRVANDGARYFGPYTNTTAMRETTRFLRKMFPVRTCTLDLSGELNYRPCLLYHINRCGAPCAGKVSPEEYNALMEQVCLFLEGRHDKLLPDLYGQMQGAAAKLEYERAARLRDQIRALEAVTERQKIVNTRQVDHDLVGFARQDDVVCMQIFHVRDGRLIGREHFFMEADADDDDTEIMTAFVKQHYQGATFIPREILLQVPVQEADVIEGWLRERRGGAVRLHVPQRGEKRRLIEMVIDNAQLVLNDQLAQLARRSEEADKALAHLTEALNLPAEPQRIEAFDISNIHGNEAVASMVVFEDGQPQPRDYRRFRIRAKDTPDDYAMMREVIERRFRRGLREQAEEVEERGFSVFPDLVVIDGGKGQLNAAREVMRELGVADIPAVGLAEGTDRGAAGGSAQGTARGVAGGSAQGNARGVAGGSAQGTVRGTALGSTQETARGIAHGNERRTDRDTDRTTDRVFMDGHKDPALLPWASPGLKLLQRIRDEAHRYALTYHRHLRDQRTSRSALDDIPGIGPRRKRELLRRFGSVAGIRRASIDEIESVPGISRALAERIVEHVRT